jgi:competence protein ComEC
MRPARAYLRRALLAAALWAAALPLPAKNREMIVTFLDCGQGDAIVIQTPNGRTVLIDAGPVEPNGEFDAGHDVVAPFLAAHHITHIDAAVFSHPHLDHIGGFKYILKHIPVKNIYDPGYSYPSPDYSEVLQLVQEKKVHYSVARAGDTLDWDPDLKVRVLGPPKTLPWDEPNNNSMVVQAQYGKIKFLFTGDIEEDAEYELVIRQGPVLESTILKVPHHGSRTSSMPELLDYVKPEVAVISCGRMNRFRHPSKKTLDRYEEYKIPVYRTDTQGSIRIVTDGKTYRVEPQGFH